MNKAEKAGRELRAMDDLAAGDSVLHHMAPLPKLLLAILFIFVTVSFPKYNFSGLLPMVLFPIFGYTLAGIPVSLCFRKLRVVLPLVCAVGLLNPFLDRAPILRLGTVLISGGVVSMVTLMMKGIFCLMASFLLAATTPIDEICHGLRHMHCPKTLTSLLLLTFRYITVLLEEVAVMTTAYHLRAPEQKGIHFSAWGSFLGQLLLRSMDRADALYESMLLRGFDGDFPYAAGKKGSPAAWAATTAAAVCILLFRTCNISQFLGSLVR